VLYLYIDKVFSFSNNENITEINKKMLEKLKKFEIFVSTRSCIFYILTRRDIHTFIHSHALTYTCLYTYIHLGLMANYIFFVYKLYGYEYVYTYAYIMQVLESVGLLFNVSKARKYIKYMPVHRFDKATIRHKGALELIER
jgi:hypothetical protein